jgi:hypothetical protein
VQISQDRICREVRVAMLRRSVMSRFLPPAPR